MAKQKLNVKLLREIKKNILAQPNLYNQNVTFQRQTECGTVACIGGWAEILSGKNDFAELCAELGVPMRHSSRLFSCISVHGSAWPKQFTSAYLAARTARGRARVAANRINHFIKTNGAE